MNTLTFRRNEYRGKYGRSRLTLFVLLDTLKMSEGPWRSRGVYYGLREMADYRVESLSYNYLRSRLTKLSDWGYLKRKAIDPEGGRPYFGYQLLAKAEGEIRKAPEPVFRECLNKVLAAIPGLSVSGYARPESKPVVEKETTEEIPVVKQEELAREIDFVPNPDRMYCLELSQGGETHFLCGYPYHKCQRYDELPYGAVILKMGPYWDKTRG